MISRQGRQARQEEQYLYITAGNVTTYSGERYAVIGPCFLIKVLLNFLACLAALAANISLFLLFFLEALAANISLFLLFFLAALAANIFGF
jgi:hypothetical protein